jgi:hypothetical protein
MSDEREPPEHTAPHESAPKCFDVVIDGVIDIQWCGRVTAPQEVYCDDSMVRSEQRNELLERDPGRRDSVNKHNNRTATLVNRDLEEGNASRHKRL